MQVGGIAASGAGFSRPSPASKPVSGTVGDSGGSLSDSGEAAVVKLQSSADRQVRFEYDFDEQELYVQVVDGNTGEVLRQIPDQEYQQLINRLQDLVDKYVTLQG